MWIQVRHWFTYSWENLVSRLGTTTLSVSIFSFLVPLLIFIGLTAVRWREEKRRGASARKIIAGALLSWPTIIPTAIYLVAWFVLLAWSLGKTASTDHNNLLERIRQLNRENKTLNSHIDDLNCKLEAKPKEITRTRILTLPTPSVATITSGMAEVRMVCSLRDPRRLPEDIFLSVPSDPLASYLEGDIGKSYLHPQGEISYKRMEEEGKAQVIQKYELPSSSNLMGLPVSQLRNYSKIAINVYGADGGEFSSCDFYEVTLRVNGNDVYHAADRIPNTINHALAPGHSPTLILRLAGLKVPE